MTDILHDDLIDNPLKDRQLITINLSVPKEKQMMINREMHYDIYMATALAEQNDTPVILTHQQARYLLDYIEYLSESISEIKDLVEELRKGLTDSKSDV